MKTGDQVYYTEDAKFSEDVGVIVEKKDLRSGITLYRVQFVDGDDVPGGDWFSETQLHPL